MESIFPHISKHLKLGDSLKQYLPVQMYNPTEALITVLLFYGIQANIIIVNHSTLVFLFNVRFVATFRNSHDTENIFSPSGFHPK